MSGIVGSKFNHRGSGLIGSLGTDGQHMLSAGAGKTNVFETVAAASADYVLLTTYTASDDATLPMDGDFTSDYKTYIYVINQLVPVTTNVNLFMLYRQGDADQTGSNYKYQIVHGYYDGSTCAVGCYGGSNVAYAKITEGDGVNNLTEGCSGTIEIYNPLQTVARKYFMARMFSQRTAEDTIQQRFTGGLYDANNTALTGITLYFGSGNVNTGTVSVYGIKP
jgi:hypothetical protein